MKTCLGEEVFWMCFFHLFWGLVCFSLFNWMLMLYLLSQLHKVRFGQSNIISVKASSFDFEPFKYFMWGFLNLF